MPQKDDEIREKTQQTADKTPNRWEIQQCADCADKDIEESYFSGSEGKGEGKKTDRDKKPKEKVDGIDQTGKRKPLTEDAQQIVQKPEKTAEEESCQQQGGLVADGIHIIRKGAREGCRGDCRRHLRRLGSKLAPLPSVHRHPD